MASEWFMRKNGEEDGPFSSQQLREMARNGLLAATDLVWKEGMADWRPAGESRRLFPRPKKGTRNETSLDVRPDQAAAAPRANSWLSQIAMPRDRRIQVGLVAGGATLLAVSVLGVVLLVSVGQPSSEDEAGSEPVATNTKPEPRNALPAEATIPAPTAAPAPVALPKGMAKRAEYRLTDEPEVGAVHQVTALAISPDNRYLAVGRGDGRLLVFDTVSGAAPLRTERANPGGDRASPRTDITTSISFSPSGKRVAWGTLFRHFAIVELGDGSVAWRSPVMARGMRADLDPPQVVLKDDDTLLVATASGLVELSTIDVCRPLMGGTPWLRLGSGAVVGDNRLTFIAKSGQGLASRGPGSWPTRRIGLSRVTAISADGTVAGLLLAEPGGASLMTFTPGGEILSTRQNLPVTVTRETRLAMLSRDTAVLASDSRVLGVSGESNTFTADLGPASPPTVLTVDADQRRVAVGRADGDIVMIAVNGAEKAAKAAGVTRFRAHATGVAQVAISPDGGRLAVSQEGAVILLDIEGKPRDSAAEKPTE